MHPTADLCDSNRDRVKVLPDGFKSFGGTLSITGRTKTVQTSGNVPSLTAILKTPGMGRVLVVDTTDTGYAAVLGDRMAGYAVENGWAGIIIDGYLRDREGIAKLAIGVWARGTCPRRPFEDNPIEEDVPILIGNIPVKTGDYLYADPDGIIITDEPIELAD